MSGVADVFSFIGDLFLVVGGAFLFLGALGLLRMPDVFNRIQAGTKAATLGALSLLVGVGFQHPEWAGKLALIALFVLITTPVGSSAIARAALLTGLRPWRKAHGEAEEKP
ncbi:MAG: monovalent cation/H(+) antiporter subunit G [Hyphomicrobiales bacterium]|nr:monovalent cation/H(+) antiporter subunit G [Hyphomicrobiales bacterium]MCP5371300.1 monovalent cation/H(+) antiporter subunit G [Hyphomicrobiales bacterium]